MGLLRILHQDADLVAVEKPAGFHVHAPEDRAHRIPKSLNTMLMLRDQLQQYVFPVHRLDRATSGVLVFALSSESARSLNEQFHSRGIRKKYFCVARGWIHEKGTIDYPLRIENGRGETVTYEAITDYDPIARLELPEAVGRYNTARYSLVEVTPHTGRMHQIRRHLAHLHHPLIGDSVHGDGAHNRFYKDKLGLPGLFLKAYSLEFIHPRSGLSIRLESRWNAPWQKVFELFGVCPLAKPELL